MPYIQHSDMFTTDQTCWSDPTLQHYPMQ